MGITSNNEERTYLLDKCEKGELPIKVGMLERKRRSKALKKVGAIICGISLFFSSTKINEIYRKYAKKTLIC